MTVSEKQGAYQPFRHDLPLGLHSWLFFAGTYAGFVLLSVAIGVGVFWGIVTSLVISFFSHSTWQASVGALLMKRFFTKSLIGFVIDAFRKKSFLRAAEEMLAVHDKADAEIEEIMQRESRWLFIIPALMLVGTGMLDWLIDANLRYFRIAESYFLLVGFIWMCLCRRGRLTMLPMASSDA
ncbi:MAG: hypothetical protein EAZ84_06100 [Verrucomicrobia bacterium]|nr:MAG: hypothetical protein EAZ84_06100 [Verrucomicrobiota bacterium]